MMMALSHEQAKEIKRAERFLLVTALHETIKAYPDTNPRALVRFLKAVGRDCGLMADADFDWACAPYEAEPPAPEPVTPLPDQRPATNAAWLTAMQSVGCIADPNIRVQN